MAADQELQRIEEKMTKLREKLKAVEEKFSQWRVENIRRRHNYVPFLLHFLKILAKRGELLPLLEKGKHKAEELSAAAKEGPSAAPLLQSGGLPP